MVRSVIILQQNSLPTVMTEVPESSFFKVSTLERQMSAFILVNVLDASTGPTRAVESPFDSSAHRPHFFLT